MKLNKKTFKKPFLYITILSQEDINIKVQCMFKKTRPKKKPDALFGISNNDKVQQDDDDDFHLELGQGSNVDKKNKLQKQVN